MTDPRPITPFTMLATSGPSCEGDECLPAALPGTDRD